MSDEVVNRVGDESVKELKTFDVTVRATVTKTIRVEAENEDAAYIEAHEEFDVLPDDWDENYTQEILDIEKVEGE